MVIFPKSISTQTITYKYLVYVHFPKIIIRNPGTPDTTYKSLIYGHFPKINISCQGTPGRTYTCLIEGLLSKFNMSVRACSIQASDSRIIFVFSFCCWRSLYLYTLGGATRSTCDSWERGRFQENQLPGCFVDFSEIPKYPY